MRTVERVRPPRTVFVGALPLVFVLSACSPGRSQVSSAIEHAWKQHPDEMAIAVGILAADQKEGTGRTLGMAARDARAIGQAYAGEWGGRALGSIIAAGSSLVRSTGVAGIAGADDRLQLSMASNWSVKDLEIKEERKSGDGYVVRTSYSLYAETSQGLQRVLLNREQVLRLVKVDGSWTVDPGGPQS